MLCRFNKTFYFPEQAAKDIESLSKMKFDELPEWFKDDNKITDDNTMILAYYRAQAVTCPEDFVVTLQDTKDGVTQATVVSTVQCRDMRSLAFVLQSVMRHYDMEGTLIIGVLMDRSPEQPVLEEFVLFVTKAAGMFGTTLSVLSSMDVYGSRKESGEGGKAAAEGEAAAESGAAAKGEAAEGEAKESEATEAEATEAEAAESESSKQE